MPKASIDRAQGKLLPCLHAAGQARPTDWPLARSPSDDRTEPTHHPTTQRCIHLLMPGYLISTALNIEQFFNHSPAATHAVLNKRAKPRHTTHNSPPPTGGWLPLPLLPNSQFLTNVYLAYVAIEFLSPQLYFGSVFGDLKQTVGLQPENVIKF